MIVLTAIMQKFSRAAKYLNLTACDNHRIYHQFVHINGMEACFLWRLKLIMSVTAQIRIRLAQNNRAVKRNAIDVEVINGVRITLR